MFCSLHLCGSGRFAPRLRLLLPRGNDAAAAGGLRRRGRHGGLSRRPPRFGRAHRFRGHRHYTVPQARLRVQVRLPPNKCWWSGMVIPDPGFFTHPGSRIRKPQQKRGVGKNLWLYLFCSHKFHKIKNYFILKCWRKKIGPVFKDLLNFLPKKFSQSSKKYGFGILFRIPDPGPEVKKAPDPVSATLPLKPGGHKEMSSNMSPNAGRGEGCDVSANE
jgi:hypothetical protein